ncbi:hypothetical protein [Paraburkholderia sp. J8-2]|uniref:hypothetical protein n=1 Tax=Paraburkholderia sp. J8-2 TaxID=2805440 RepID=UPI002AB6F13D|nr:hypothetical protein [Paraburkholderia sp. J8-2]
MAITRAPRPNNNFYILDKAISEDSRLSWASRGLLVYLLGKPDYWQVSVAALIADTQGARIKSGRDAVRAMVSELIDVGYVRRTPRRGDDGRMEGYDYTVSEECAAPETGNPALAPETGNPATVNPLQVSIDKKQGLSTSIPGGAKKKQTGNAKGAKTALPEGFAISERVREWANEGGHKNLEKHFAAFVLTCKAKGYKYADWDSAFMVAVRNDWAKLEGRGSLAGQGGQGARRNGRSNDRSGALQAIYGKSESGQGDFIDV